MKKILVVLILITSCAQNKINRPPLAPSQLVVDDYFGVKINDPYRNLENLKDSVVIDWMHQQQDYTTKILSAIPKRDEFIKKLQAFDAQKSFEISKLKVTNNDIYFYLKRLADEDLGKLYCRKGLNGEEQLLYNVAIYKKNDATSYKIDYIQPSWNGRKIAVSISKKGIEVSEIIFIDVEQNEVLPYTLKNCTPTTVGDITWLPDSSGVIYQRIVSKDLNDKNGIFNNTESVLFKFTDYPKQGRVILSAVTQKELQIQSEDFPYAFFNHITDDYVFGEITGATAYVDTYFTTKEAVQKGIPNWELLFKASEKVKRYELKGDTLYYLTAKDASNFKICKNSITNFNSENAVEVVPEKKDRVIRNFVLTKDKLYFTTVKNGVEAKLYQSVDDEEKEVKLPMNSGVIRITSKGIGYSDIWITAAGWNSPKVRYAYNAKNEQFTKADLSPNNTISDFEDIVVKEVEVSSHDGVLVPLSLIHKKETGKRQSKPTMILAYGAYGSSMSPFFSASFLNFVNEGGVFAVAHVRGGGEKGDAWHKGGYKLTKPNSWKDFIACTEYLINESYTTKEQTIAIGSSAGGITIGRAVTDRPDLYAVCIASVPSMNVLRYEAEPNGGNNIKEYGSHKDSLKFRALLEMDSYHHIRDGEQYPATLITTGINDFRVAAWNPAKFAAKMQAANSSENPILLSVDFDAGHLSNNGKLKGYTNFANYIAFALWQTGHPDYTLDTKALQK
jgi:prolyl oligopeptidase